MRSRSGDIKAPFWLSFLSLLILGLLPWSHVHYHDVVADSANRSGNQNDNYNTGSGDATQNQEHNNDDNQAHNKNKNYKSNNGNGSYSASTTPSTAYAIYNKDGEEITFDAVSIMPVSCINYNKGNLIKFQLFERTTSYKCHFRELGTYVVSIAHFMRSYFNYQALVKGNKFDLPKDASYLNCVMVEQTLNSQKLYAKIGCDSDSDSSVTSTKFSLHLYTNKKCTLLLDSTDASYKSKFGYLLNGRVFSTELSFRPPFFTCMHCQPDEIANSFTKSRSWYDDDYINVQGGNKVYVYEDDKTVDQNNLDDYYDYKNATNDGKYYNWTNEDNSYDNAVQSDDDASATKDYYNYNAHSDASAEDGDNDDAVQNDVNDDGVADDGDQAASNNDGVYYYQRTDDKTAAISSSDDDAATIYYSNTNDDTTTATTTVTDDFAAQYFSKADDDTNQNYNFNEETYYIDDANGYYFTDDNVNDCGSTVNGDSAANYEAHYADNDDQAVSSSSSNSSHYATDDEVGAGSAYDDDRDGDDRENYYANTRSEENEYAANYDKNGNDGYYGNAGANNYANSQSEVSDDDANDDLNGDDAHSGYYRQLSSSNQADKVLFFVPVKDEVEKFTTNFWNDVSATRQRFLEGSSSSSTSTSNNNRNNIDAVGHYWNFCQRLHYYGLECGSDCQALNSFRYNHWTRPEITLLVGMCAFMVVMILCIFTRQVRASKNAYIYGDEFDLPADPQLTSMTLMITFAVLLAAITGMAKLKLVGETLVLALAACMLLFIYVLKQALFENMGGHNSLFSPRKSGDDPSSMVLDRHFDSMNRQLFDA